IRSPSSSSQSPKRAQMSKPEMLSKRTSLLITVNLRLPTSKHLTMRQSAAAAHIAAAWADPATSTSDKVRVLLLTALSAESIHSTLQRQLLQAQTGLCGLGLTATLLQCLPT